MPFHKTYITHQRTFSPVQPSHQFAVTATQLCKFSYRSFCYIGQSRYTSNDSLGPSYQAFQFASRLDVPAFTPMLVGPVLRPTTMLEGPAHLTPKHDINSALLWPPAYITFGPSYPHEPGPAAATTDQAATTTNFILFPSCSYNLLWFSGRTETGPSNPHDPGPSSADAHRFGVDSHACGPSNPHDPGPSAAVADFIITFFTNLLSLITANYALVDFVLIPPRSPSIVYIVL